MKDSKEHTSSSWEKASDQAARKLFPEWYGLDQPSDPNDRMFWPPPSSAPLDYHELLKIATALRASCSLDDKNAASKAAEEAWRLMTACHRIMDRECELRAAIAEHEQTIALRSNRTVEFSLAVSKIVGDTNDARAKKQFAAYIEAYWGEVDLRRSNNYGYCEPVDFCERETWVESVICFHSEDGFSEAEIKSHSARYQSYVKEKILEKTSKVASKDNRSKIKDEKPSH